MLTASLLGKVVLVLLGLGFLVYEVIRIRRTHSNFPEKISGLAVSIGVLGLFVDSFNFAPSRTTTIMSISAALILGGIALDLGFGLYRRLVAGTDKGSRITN